MIQDRIQELYQRLLAEHQKLEGTHQEIHDQLAILQFICSHPNLNIAWKAGSRLLRCPDCGLWQEEPIQVQPHRFAVGDRVRFNPLLGPRAFIDQLGQECFVVTKVDGVDGQPDWQWVTIAGQDTQQTFNCLWLVPA